VTLRLLHTSDWHLGHRLHGRDRAPEHEAMLAWLLDVLRQEAVDMLLIAGDVFDTTSPPAQAFRHYYDFLSAVSATGCQHTVVLGGNHDSPTVLNAPAELLRSMRIHVVGCVPRGSTDPEHGRNPEHGRSEVALHEELLELPIRHDPEHGRGMVLIAATPFLRERDLKSAQPGETQAEREQAIREGIRAHYAALADYAQARRAALDAADAPLIAGGHLFCAGACAGEGERAVHLGNLGQISAEEFPSAFAYVALGHLHQAQRVGGCSHIRYSGAPLPMGCQDAARAKQVLLVEFNGPNLGEVRAIPVPVFRAMHALAGSQAEVEAALAALPAVDSATLQPWLEIVLDADAAPPQLQADLHQQAAERGYAILRIALRRAIGPANGEEMPPLALELASAEEIFLRKCHDAGKTAQQTEVLLALLHRLQDWMDNNEPTS